MPTLLDAKSNNPFGESGKRVDLRGRDLNSFVFSYTWSTAYLKME